MAAIKNLLARQPTLLLGALAFANALPAAAQEQSNSLPKAINYSAFQIIADRNIFNPNRYARSSTYRPRSTRTVRRAGFMLTGTMSYTMGETPGTYAFFDGTSSDFRKVLQAGGDIAGFKVTAIRNDSVTLQSQTNELVLSMGMQLLDDGGKWVLTTNTTRFASAAADEPGRNYASVRRSGSGSAQTPADGAMEGADTNALAGVDGAMPPGNEDLPPQDENGQPPEAGPADTVTVPPGPAGDALQRLMQLRQQEEQGIGNR